MENFLVPKNSAKPAGDTNFFEEVTVGKDFVVVSHTPARPEKNTLYVTPVPSNTSVNHTLTGDIGGLGFDFPGGKTIAEDHCLRIEFDDKPQVTLPREWRRKHCENSKALSEIFDEKGRFRGFLSSKPEMKTASLELHGRFRLDAGIVARTADGLPLFAIRLMDGRKVLLNMFVKVGCIEDSQKPKNWEKLEKDQLKVEGSYKWLVSKCSTLFPGLFDSYLRLENGNIFTSWNMTDEAVLRNISQLRKELGQSLPEQLGEDNSMVLSVLPSDDFLKEIKENPPEYTPPPPPPSSLMHGIRRALGL